MNRFFVNKYPVDMGNDPKGNVYRYQRGLFLRLLESVEICLR
jgi:hypothetical protein